MEVWSVAKIVTYLAQYGIEIRIVQGTPFIYPPSNLVKKELIVHNVLPHLRAKRMELVAFFENATAYPPKMTELQRQAYLERKAKEPPVYESMKKQGTRTRAIVEYRTSSPPGRNIWYLQPDGLPVKLGGTIRMIPLDATHMCYEGAEQWKKLPRSLTLPASAIRQKEITSSQRSMV